MTVALTDHALTTLADVKTELGISGSTEDDYISRLINAVSDMIRFYCGRTFYYEEDIEESVAGYGQTRLLVSRTPIVGSISSITYEGTAIDTTIYSVEDADAGIIYCSYGFNWTAQLTGKSIGEATPGTEALSYVVTYDGGYYTPQQYVVDNGTDRSLPYDLEDACIQLVAGRYRAKGRDPRISAEHLKSWGANYGGPEDRSHAIPASIRSTLDRYKRLGHG